MSSQDPEGIDVSRRMLAHKSDIIEIWKERLRTDIRPARKLPEPIILDSLPDWIDRLVQSLASPNVPTKLHAVSLAAREHAEDRVRVNFDLNELLYEYVLLRQVTFDVLESEGPLSPRQRDIILDAIQTSSRSAANEYVELQHRRTQLEILKKMERSKAARFVISVFLVALATLLQWFMWPIVQPLAYFFYYPAIVLAALAGDGLLSIALSVLAAQYFFVPPVFSLRIQNWQEGVRAGIFILTAFLISRITDSLRLSQKVSEEALLNQQRAKREAEEAMDRERAARTEAEQQNELRQILLSAISHDLRGPLTSAKTSLQMIHRYADKPEAREKMLNRVSDGIDRINQMIEDLLDANRIRAGQNIPLDIVHCDFVQTAQDVLEELASIHGNRFILRSPESLEGYWSCPAIRRVLENLCNNAIKYGASDSPITITIDSGPASAAIAVHNLGSTISPEEREKLFIPFHRSPLAEKSGQKGWGIGLTIVQGIVKAHGGTIHVKSEKEEGTTFRIELPLDARSHQEKR